MSENSKKRNRRSSMLSWFGSYFAVFIFILTLSFVGVLSITMPKSESSEIEKRELTKMPSFSIKAYSSGEFTDNFSLYYSDNFPFREELVLLSKRFTENFGESYDGIRLTAGESYFAPPPAEENKPEPPELLNTAIPPYSENPPKEDSSQIVIESSSEESSSEAEQINDSIGETEQPINSNGMFIYNNAAYQIYYGGEKTAYSYAQAVSTIASQLPNVNVYNLVVPTGIEFALPEEYSSISADQKEDIDILYNNINELSGGTVKTIDAYNEIEKHQEEYLYFRTDHHWTARGAYYAYHAFCDSLGIPPTPLESMTQKEKPNFLGTMYSNTQNSSLLENPDTVEYFMQPTKHTASYYQNEFYAPTYVGNALIEFAEGANSYSVFIAGDFPITIIETEAQNDKSICVVKESFGNAFVPFLVNNYSKIIVIDPRHFNGNFGDVMDRHNIEDLLIINNIFAAHSGGNKNLIWGLSSDITAYYDGSYHAQLEEQARIAAEKALLAEEEAKKTEEQEKKESEDAKQSEEEDDED